MKNFFRFVALIVVVATISSQAAVKLGNEVLVDKKFKLLAGKRIGLITNPSGVNSKLESVVDILHNAPEVNLVALFGPEHGIYGDVPAGDKVTNRVDIRTGLPVHSLYGETRKPTTNMLKGLDALVMDVQDAGVRSYTFISTMGLAMAACGEAGIEFIVLDRPNPLGGERMEGPMVTDEFRSFVSQYDIPYAHGMTIGELARMINAERWVTNQCKLTVVPMKGWKRSMLWPDTKLQWVPTSPHVPENTSPMYMTATGIIGELGGAQYRRGSSAAISLHRFAGMDMWKTAETLNAYKIPGVKFKPLTYKPYYGPFTTNVISGAQLYILDPRRAPLTAINFYIIEAVKKVSGHDLFVDAKKILTKRRKRKQKPPRKKRQKIKPKAKNRRKRNRRKLP